MKKQLEKPLKYLKQDVRDNEDDVDKIGEDLKILERQIALLENAQENIENFPAFRQNSARNEYNNLMLNSAGKIDAIIKDFKKINGEIKGYKKDFEEVSFH